MSFLLVEFFVFFVFEVLLLNGDRFFVVVVFVLFLLPLFSTLYAGCMHNYNDVYVSTQMKLMVMLLFDKLCCVKCVTFASEMMPFFICLEIDLFTHRKATKSLDWPGYTTIDCRKQQADLREQI